MNESAEPVRISVAAEREFVCPAFPLHYPVVRNEELISETSLAAMVVS